MNRLRRLLDVAAAVALVLSCTSAPDKRAENAAGPTRMIAIGTITRFGDVVVNDVEWDTQTTRILVNGEPAALDALRAGMVVRVEGVRLAKGAVRGKAQTLRYDADLIGPLQRDAVVDTPGAPDVTALKVAGQTLLADAGTRFEGFAALTSLEHNDVVEISGLRDARGLLRATWIKRIGGIEALATETRVKGVAQEVKPAQFKLGELVVLGPEHKIRNGDFVAVNGKWRVAAPELAASGVRKLPAVVSLPESVSVSMQGLIHGVSATGFTLHGRPVAIRAATVFDNGSAQDLREGGRVHVEGVLKSAVFEAARVVLAATH